MLDPHDAPRQDTCPSLPISERTLDTLRCLLLHPERIHGPTTRLQYARTMLGRPDLSYDDLPSLTERQGWLLIDSIDNAFGLRPRGASRGTSRRRHLGLS